MGESLKLTVLHFNHGKKDFLEPPDTPITTFQEHVAEWLNCKPRQLILMYHGQTVGGDGSIRTAMPRSGSRLTAIIDEEEEVASVELPEVPPRPVAPVKTWVKSYRDREEAREAAERYKKNHPNSSFGDFGFGGLHDFGMRGMDAFGMRGLEKMMGGLEGMMEGMMGGIGGLGGMMGGMGRSFPGAAKPGTANPSAAQPGPSSNGLFNSFKQGFLKQPRSPAPHVSKEAEEAAIRHLMEMGAEEAKAREVYAASGKNLEIAVDRLFA